MAAISSRGCEINRRLDSYHKPARKMLIRHLQCPESKAYIIYMCRKHGIWPTSRERPGVDTLVHKSGPPSSGEATGLLFSSSLCPDSLGLSPNRQNGRSGRVLARDHFWADFRPFRRFWGFRAKTRPERPFRRFSTNPGCPDTSSSYTTRW